MLASTSSASAALVAVVASFLGGAAASPVLSNRDGGFSFSNGGLALLPAPFSDGDFSGIFNDLSLGSQSNYYWANQGILGNMTVKVSDKFRLLNPQNFKGVVQAVNCSSSKISVKFNNADSLNSAKDAWRWVNKAASNTVVYVADGGACGGQNGRQPYFVKSVSYNDKSNTAVLSSSVARWADFAEDATLRIHSPDANSDVVKRGFGDIVKGALGDVGDVSKSVSIDTNHDFTGPILTTTVDGVTLTLNCDDCKTTGSLSGDITLSLSNGMRASLTTQNSFGVRFAMGLKASGSLSQPFVSQSVRLATVPLAGFSIGGVAEIGPQLSLDAQASISGLNAQVTTHFGLAMTLADGSTLGIGQQTDLQPNFEPIGPSVDGSISMTAKVNPLATLDLAATFLGKGVVAGVGLQAPTLSATVKAAADSAGGACDNSNAAVSFEVDVGVEVDAFGGFGSAQDQPNKFAIFTKSTPVFSQCLPLSS